MKTISNIFYALFIALLVLVGGLFLTSLMPIKTGIETKIVQSGSMEPSIPVGALVFVRPSASYGVGDVVTFGGDTSSAVPTTHRILGVRTEGGKEFYTTKGDANEEADPQEVARSEVVGKVFLSVPYAGFVLDFAKQPLGFALLIGVPALLVIIAELVAIVQEVLGLRRRRVLASKPARRRLPLAVSISNPPDSIEYVRLFAMDDVFIPVRIFETHVRSLSAHHYTRALTSTLAVVCISLVVSFSNAGGTLSYFRDTELSTGNTFGAGTWPNGTSLGFSIDEQALSVDVPQDSEGAVGENESGEEIVQEEDTPQDEGEEGSVREGRGERGEREERNDVAPVIPEARASVENASLRPDLGDADSATNSDQCLGLECT